MSAGEGRAPWRATVLTIFPEMFPGPLAHSLAGRALGEGLWSLETVDIRAHAGDKHASVDGPAFGGGGGMVMRPDVLASALDSHRGPRDRRPALVLSARGRPLAQSRVRRLSEADGVVAVCGRYEGIDQRFIEARGLEEVSLGDFVLSGGEPAAIALIDAAVRLLPGVTGAVERLRDESFEDGLLEYPQYTRPRTWEGRTPPEVLLSGDHGAVERWRREAAERTTRERRPDLWAALRNEGGGAEGE